MVAVWRAFRVPVVVAGCYVAFWGLCVGIGLLPFTWLECAGSAASFLLGSVLFLPFCWRRLDSLAGVVSVVASGFVIVSVVAVFGVLKSNQIAVFTWDRTLAGVDALVHGGPAWRWAWSVFGDWVRAFDLVYWAWLFVVMGCMYWQAWRFDRVAAARSLLCWALCWIVLGNVVAVMFGSAGPCYFARVAGENRFAELMGLLGGRGLYARSLQADLWSWHVAGLTGGGSGVSAFPSMHVSQAVWVALTLGAASWRAGVVGWLFAGCIVVGSVMLGWHYGIDGYVSVVGTLLLWYVSGLVVCGTKVLKGACRGDRFDFGLCVDRLRRSGARDGAAVGL